MGGVARDIYTFVDEEVGARWVGTVQQLLRQVGSLDIPPGRDLHKQQGRPRWTAVQRALYLAGSPASASPLSAVTVPSRYAGSFQGSQHHAVMAAEALADATKRPAEAVQPDRFSDLVGRQ